MKWEGGGKGNTGTSEEDVGPEKNRDWRGLRIDRMEGARWKVEGAGAANAVQCAAQLIHGQDRSNPGATRTRVSTLPGPSAGATTAKRRLEGGGGA